MRTGCILILCMLLTGCAGVDSFFGVDDQGQVTTETPVSDVVGRAASMFVPGAGDALLILGGLWAAIRGRRWKTVAGTVVSGVDAALKSTDGNGKIDIKEVLAELHKKQVQVPGAHAMVKKLRERL